MGNIAQQSTELARAILPTRSGALNILELEWAAAPGSNASSPARGRACVSTNYTSWIALTLR